MVLGNVCFTPDSERAASPLKVRPAPIDHLVWRPQTQHRRIKASALAARPPAFAGAPKYQAACEKARIHWDAATKKYS